MKKLKKKLEKKEKEVLKNARNQLEVIEDKKTKTEVTDDDRGGRSMAPMTKEEWEKRQSVIKRVFDETTGRHR